MSLEQLTYDKWQSYEKDIKELKFFRRWLRTRWHDFFHNGRVMPDSKKARSRFRSVDRTKALIELIYDADLVKEESPEDRIYLIRIKELDAELYQYLLESTITDSYEFEAQRY